MELPTGHLPMLWPFGVYVCAVLLVVAGMIGISFLLGEHRRDRATATPYESGIAVTGDARVRLSVKFYLVAMFFVVFDLEAVFIYAWAVAARELGWAGYAEVLVFIGVLVATLAYLWREGALDWGPTPARRPARLASERTFPERQPAPPPPTPDAVPAGRGRE